MKQVEMNGQYFEKLTSRVEASEWLKEVKESEWLPDEGGVFIEYLDGKTAFFSDDDDFSKMKTSNVKTMVYDGGYGYTFYNAIPQLDLTYPDMPMIRIGTACHEYGETVRM